MTLSPLRGSRDYEAAQERLAELEEESDADDDSLFEEADDEAEALEMLIDEFEDREGIEEAEDDDFELVPRLPDPQPERIASFVLSNGNTVDFMAAPFGSEVFVVEMSDEGSEDIVLEGEFSPVMMYGRLSERSAPVPRAIARLDRAGLLGTRDVCDVATAQMEVDLARLGAGAAAQAAQGGSCQGGGGGAAFFQAHHCGTGGGPGYGKSESHCYPNASAWIQKTSSSRRRATYSRMAACGSSTCRLRHFYKKASGYHMQLLIDVAPPRVVSYWSYKKGVRRYRRVRFERLNDNAFVRGWVKYHSQAADISV